MMLTCRRLFSPSIPLVLLALLLLLLGGQQASDPVPLDAAMELQIKGKTDQAIALLVPIDIEKNIQASSLKTLKMSEKQFRSLFNYWGRADHQQESLLMLPLIKKAAYLQIEKMQAAEAAGLSDESKEMQKQLKRLVRFLQDKNRLLIYQQLGTVIDKKMKQAPSNETTNPTTTKTKSTDAD